MRTLSLVIALAACGHSAPPATTSSGSAAQAECEPGRCLEDISNVLAGHKAESRACAGKKVTGRVIINFTIDAEGKVGEASQGMQDDQIQDKAVVDCLTAVVQSVQFA